MWPFSNKKKLIQAPVSNIDQQLKSISFPSAQPEWKLNNVSASNWDSQAAISEGYVASAIVYACIEKRAKLIASVPWCAIQVKSDGTKQKEPNSPLQKLIDRPNPDQSWYELIYNGSQSLDLSGHTFISKTRAGINNNPRELWYLPSKDMKLRRGKVRLIDQYVYLSNHEISADDMVMLKMPNPDSAYFGMPVLMSAGRATDIDRESGIWQKVSLQNRGASDINIKLPENATQEQVDSVKGQYKTQQSGPQNARKALITNADIQQLGQTAVELDFIASRRSVWTEICAVFGLSLSNLGMTEDVNLANAEAMNKALWENTIIPQLELMQRQFTHQLARDFGEDWIMAPDLANVKALQKAAGQKLDEAVKLWAMGVPFNAISEKLELGIADIEGGDIGYISSGSIPTNFDFSDPQDPEAEV